MPTIPTVDSGPIAELQVQNAALTAANAALQDQIDVLNDPLTTCDDLEEYYYNEYNSCS